MLMLVQTENLRQRAGKEKKKENKQKKTSKQTKKQL